MSAVKHVSPGQHYGVAPSLLAAVASVGTGYRADAATATTPAQGLMQLRPAVAAALAVDAAVPGQSIDGAARRLAALWSGLHDERAVIALYPTAVQSATAAAAAPADATTRAYVSRVIAAASA